MINSKIMNLQLPFFPTEQAEGNPELFFDDQPVESLIYHTEQVEQPTPADIRISQYHHWHKQWISMNEIQGAKISDKKNNTKHNGRY
jgi:hypothetical protein